MQVDVDYLRQLLSSFTQLYAELFLALLYLVILIFGLFRQTERYTFEITFLGIALHIIVLIFFPYTSDVSSTFWQYDKIAHFTKILMAFALLGALLFFPKKEFAEYYSLLVAVLLGAQLLVMARHFLLMFLAIEIMSISSYVLVFFRINAEATASALRYLIFGSAASATSLYGISLLYGMQGTFFWSHLHVEPTDESFTIMAVLLLVLASLLFKTTLVPFHFWIADVYEQLPSQVLAFFSVVPKISALIALYQLSKYLPHTITIYLLGVVALVSILIGNLAALLQKKLRKLFAFSSVAHAGFLLTALIPRSLEGIQAFLFYSIVYVLMNYAFVYVLSLQEKHVKHDEVAFWNGIGNTQPLLGVLIIILMISLTGLPITAGFTAKLFAFSALWEYYEATQNGFLLILFAVGLLNILVALFYYLKVPYVMFFKVTTSRFRMLYHQYGVLLLLIIPMLILFFIPNVLMNFLIVLLK